MLQRWFRLGACEEVPHHVVGPRFGVDGGQLSSWFALLLSRGKVCAAEFVEVPHRRVPNPARVVGPEEELLPEAILLGLRDSWGDRNGRLCLRRFNRSLRNDVDRVGTRITKDVAGLPRRCGSLISRGFAEAYEGRHCRERRVGEAG